MPNTTRKKVKVCDTIEPKIIYEDKYLLIIDKPPSMPSVEISRGKEETLSGWILTKYPEQSKLSTLPKEGGLINRLDNETSGIVVCAKTNDAYKTLRETWNKKKVLKEYLCLVIGQIYGVGKISAFIAHHPDKPKKMIVVTDRESAKKLNARRAETDYQVLKNFSDYSYLKVTISAGIRHQIRCHLSSIGYPIAGDKIYRRAKHKARDFLKLERHFLHASKVGFLHPVTEKYVEFESPLPKDVRNALARCKLNI